MTFSSVFLGPAAISAFLTFRRSLLWGCFDAPQPLYLSSLNIDFLRASVHLPSFTVASPRAGNYAVYHPNLIIVILFQFLSISANLIKKKKRIVVLFQSIAYHANIPVPTKPTLVSVYSPSLSLSPLSLSIYMYIFNRDWINLPLAQSVTHYHAGNNNFTRLQTQFKGTIWTCKPWKLENITWDDANIRS